MCRAPDTLRKVIRPSPDLSDWITEGDVCPNGAEVADLRLPSIFVKGGRERVKIDPDH